MTDLYDKVSIQCSEITTQSSRFGVYVAYVYLALLKRYVLTSGMIFDPRLSIRKRQATLGSYSCVMHQLNLI
jgi:hypothetical protein